MNTYGMHILWRFEVNTSKIARFIGKKLKKFDYNPVISNQDFH